MTRHILSDGDFSSNFIGVEPDSTIVDLDLWAYLNTSLAASPNMITDTALTQTGAVTFNAGHAGITPAVNYLTPSGLVDVADQTIMFVARTAQTGGNYSPIVTAYPSGVGLFIALGWNYVRVHAAGFGSIGNFVFSGTYGNEWSFWSVTLDSGHATPIRVKNWTHGETVTGGTAAGTRISTGNNLTIAQHTIATFGTFGSDAAFVGRAKSILSDAQGLTCYDSVRLGLEEFGITGV